MESLGKNRCETIGLLVLLWSNSQARGFIEGPKAQILKFIESKKSDKEGTFLALFENDYIRYLGDDHFEICGNRKHVEKLDALYRNAKKGGEKSGESRKKEDVKTKPEQVQGYAENESKRTLQHNEAYAEAPASTVEAHAEPHCYSILFDSIQNNTNTGADKNEISQQMQTPPPVALPNKRSKFSDETREKMRAFFASYAECYKTRYGGPPEGIKDKALIGRVGHWIESVSGSRANQLVQVYLQIDYRPFTESCHDLWQFFRHLNRIGNSLTTGEVSGSTNWSKIFGGTS